MTLIIAHRGASGYRPEHTRGAYRLALALGADAVEPDLVPSRDGVLVIRHEPEISTTTDIADRPEFAGRRRRRAEADGAGWFTVDFDWAELATLRSRERLPMLRPESAAHDGEDGLLRLADLLALLPEETVLVAELKHPARFAELGFDLPALFARELAAAGGRPAARLVVECFELPALVALAERGVAATYVLLSETPIDLAELPASVGGVSYEKGLLLAPGGDALVAAAHASGRLVYAWTLRPENEFLAPGHRREGPVRAWGDWRAEYRAVLATGVDGVFADHPDLARAALAD